MYASSEIHVVPLYVYSKIHKNIRGNKIEKSRLCGTFEKRLLASNYFLAFLAAFLAAFLGAAFLAADLVGAAFLVFLAVAMFLNFN
jgi:hypothetical protein